MGGDSKKNTSETSSIYSVTSDSTNSTGASGGTEATASDGAFSTNVSLQTERTPLLPRSSHSWVDRFLIRHKKPPTSSPEDYTPHAHLDASIEACWPDLKTSPNNHSSIIVKDLYSSAEEVIAQLRIWARRDGSHNILTRRDADSLIYLTSTGKYILHSCDVYTAYD